MKRFLCRVMVVVFSLNCLTPATGWGQASRRSLVPSEEDIQAQIQAAQLSYDPASLYEWAAEETRWIHQEQFILADYVADQQREFQAIENRQNYVAVPNSTRVRTPVVAVPVFSSVKDFLRHVETGKLSFEDLINYADPLDTDIQKNNLLISTYAAEIMGNNISKLAQVDASEYDLFAVQEMLAQIEARLAYRLAFLGKKVPSYVASAGKEPASQARTALQQQLANEFAIYQTMLVGTLRMTLLKIHQFYQAKNLPDPAEEYQKQKLAERMKKQNTQAPQQTIWEIQPAAVTGGLPEATIEERAAQGVQKHGNLAKFQQQFIDELKELLAQKPEEGTQAYQNLQLLAEYATAYALEYKPEAVKEIVKIFDKGVKRTISGKIMDGDFHRPYEPILDAVFNIVFENTRYSTMNAEQTKKVLNLLRDFSDREQYSLPTQVFSLEVASLLYRPFNKETLRQVDQQRPGFYPVNLNQPDENLRALFAKRIVDIYCPLTAYNYKSYGLSSQEMQALADELAYMYDGLYDISSSQIHMPGQDPHRYPTQCKMVMKNEPNRVKKNKEEQIQILSFTANTIFWVYGGELFAYVGTAYRLTRGAVAAMPKAYKAFKGTRALNAANMGRFNAALQRGRTGLKLAGQEIKEGAKFSNFVGKNINQQGYTIEFLTRQTPAKTAVRAPGSVEAPATYHPVGGWRALQGKGSLWNPKNWFGSPQQEILSMRVTRMEPGLKVTQGEVRFGEMVNGHFVEQPISGFKSMAQVNEAFGKLVQADGSRFLYQTKPYWTALQDLNQVQFEQRMLSGLQQAFKHQTNSWIPMENITQDGIQANHWWNITQWGKPRRLVGEIQNMPLYITPKTPLEWVRDLAQQVQSPNLRANLHTAFPGLYEWSTTFSTRGMPNVPQQFLGFFTTAEEVASGTAARQLFNSFFRPMNWAATPTKLITNGVRSGKWQAFSSGMKHAFLPDYMPTADFWKFAKANPILGAQLIPNLLWRNRFMATTLFFAGFMGVDRVIYPPYKGWMLKEATQETQQEIAKYGNAFSPQRVKEDELLLQQLGEDLSDTRARRVSQNVQGAQPEKKDGTLLVAPIVLARRVLGNTQLGKALGAEVSFVNDARKADYAYKATRANLAHAKLVKAANQVKQSEQIPEKTLQEEQRAQIEQAEQQIVTAFEQGLAVQPQLKQEIHRIFQVYTQDYLKAETDEARMKIDEWFTQQMEPVMAQAQEVNTLITQTQSIVQAPEQYIQNQIQMAQIMYSDLITPEVENQLRRVYEKYARACQAALKSANPLKQLDKAIQTRVEKEEKIYNELFNQGYGPNFDPNAAEK